MPYPLLELRNVSVRYGEDGTAVTALNDVSISVARGELVAVMGASGSGKSSLLSIAGGLTPPTHGHVLIEGRETDQLSSREVARMRRKVLGFIFQDYNLIPTLSAVENVALPLELDGWSRRRARDEARSALDAVGLSDRAQHHPSELSGGQQQRVAIARAVVGGRSLILADEPTGALDSASSLNVMASLRDRVDSGAGAVVVTHDASVAAWADRRVILSDGEVTQYSESESIAGPSSS